MKSLPIRVLSATVAVLILATLFYFFEKDGLILLCYFASGWGTAEYMRLINRNAALTTCIGAGCSNAVICMFLSSNPNIAFPVVFALFALITAWHIIASRHEADLQKILSSLLTTVFGLIYLVVFPFLAVEIISHENGVFWFSYLLAVVFTGDIVAFFFGILLGKEKIVPFISPNKTIVGSVGGLVGSLVASFVLVQAFNLQNPIYYMVGAVFVSACAQTGDFFESMLKRISNVKDSGKIMPGHGGILDRIDGVLFAVPVVYLLSILIFN